MGHVANIDEVVEPGAAAIYRDRTVPQCRGDRVRDQPAGGADALTLAISVEDMRYDDAGAVLLVVHQGEPRCRGLGDRVEVGIVAVADARIDAGLAEEAARVENVDRAQDIGFDEGFRHPDGAFRADQGRQVDHPVDLRDRLRHRLVVADIGQHEIPGGPKLAGVPTAQDQRRVPRLRQRRHDMAADEALAAGNEDFHCLIPLT